MTGMTPKTRSTEKSNKFLFLPIFYVRRVVEPANQGLASTATPEPIHNNTDIVEIDKVLSLPAAQ